MTDNFINRDKLPHLYNQVFNRDPAGVAVLDHLWDVFMDREDTTNLDPQRLAFAAGQRSVVRFITIQRDRLERELKETTE